jgi:hypothetical protein
METDEEYFVLAYRRCEVCHGTGEIEHPLWAGFLKWMGGRSDRMSRSARDAWWREHGYPRGEPEEKLHCIRCQKGMVPVYLPLKEALSRASAAVKSNPLNITSVTASQAGKSHPPGLEAVDRRP